VSDFGNCLRVSLVQTSLAWQDVEANLQHFSVLLAPLAGSTDVVLLPEMFTSGFTMEAEKIAPRSALLTLPWLKAQARKLDAAIAGSVISASAGRFVNRLLWVTPDGEVHHYDKRHLFRMGGEHRAFAAGAVPLLITWRGVRIAPLICYDLRFPVWSRRRESYDFELLLYVANWPAARAYAWTHLLRARAIENQCFVAAVNRIGRDGHGVPHQGDS
jgi:omega-amidase